MISQLIFMTLIYIVSFDPFVFLFPALLSRSHHVCLLRRLVIFVASLEEFPLLYWDPASLPDLLFGRINRKHHQNIPYIVQNIVQNHHYQLTFEVMKKKFVRPTNKVENHHHHQCVLLLLTMIQLKLLCV